MNILLTGVTGMIGREVLREFLGLAMTTPQGLKIMCLVRASQYASAQQRISGILQQIAPALNTNEKELVKYIQVIDTSNDVPRSYSSLIHYLNKSGIKDLKVMHLAANTNLSTLASSEEEIYTQNYLNTMDLLERIIPYTKQFSFASAAYACGHQKGTILPEYGTLPIKANRNYYERLKLDAEKRIKQVCDFKGIKWQILRPSIVCGRLLQEPYYYTPKFTMLYAWARFFYDLNMVGVHCEGMRIKANLSSGINIISSDYVAKAMARAFMSIRIGELNIVHSINCPVQDFLAALLENTGIQKYHLVAQASENLSTAEKIYYETIGLQLSPYINTPEHQFDTHLLRGLMYDIPEPNIGQNFKNILDFAILREFRDEIPVGMS